MKRLSQWISFGAFAGVMLLVNAQSNGTWTTLAPLTIPPTKNCE
jgi:hypothetical protein